MKPGIVLAIVVAGVVTCGREDPDPAFSFHTISAGGHHTCGIDSTGTTYCWGDNTFGQLGDGSMNNSRPFPWRLGGPTFVTVSAGYAHTCGVTIADVVYCWGSNEFGQLGDSTTTSRSEPVAVRGGSGMNQVSAGFGHTCAVSLPGVVHCWGDNSAGQLGDSTTTPRLIPTPVADTLALDGVSAGRNHTCAYTRSYDLDAEPYVGFCWGANVFGQLGDSTNTPRLTPTRVRSSDVITSVAAGQYHTCGAVSYISMIHCWGDNGAGQLGDGGMAPRWDPGLVDGSLSAFPIAAGAAFSCAVAASADTHCWGDNGDGQLGDGSMSQRLSPVPVSGGRDFFGLTAGSSHACAIEYGFIALGPAYCWGDNSAGQLGDGTTTDRNRPVRVVR